MMHQMIRTEPAERRQVAALPWRRVALVDSVAKKARFLSVAARVVAALAAGDPPRRQWAAHALTRLMPRDEKVLQSLVPYLRDPSPEVATRIAWLLQSQPLPRGVARAVRELERSAPEREPVMPRLELTQR